MEEVKIDYWKKLRNALGSQQLILTSAAGAIVKNDKILLARNSEDGKWYIPGGLQELNEAVQDTIVRELKEEFGLILEIDKLISIYSSPKWIIELSNDDKIQQVLFFFLMRGDFNEDKVILQKSEIYEYAFFNMKEIPENIMPCCKEKIQDLINYKGTVFLK